MKKEEFIARYGIDKYKQRLKRTAERLRLRRATDPEYQRYAREFRRKQRQEIINDPVKHEQHLAKRREYINKRSHDPNDPMRERIRRRDRLRFIRDGEQHLIENYELALKDDFIGWDLHHRLELTLDGEFALDTKTLKRLNMYYNRPHFELIYLRRSEHSKLHNQANPRGFCHKDYWSTHTNPRKGRCRPCRAPDHSGQPQNCALPKAQALPSTGAVLTPAA